MLNGQERDVLLACQAGFESYAVPLAAVSRILRAESLEPNTQGTQPPAFLVDGGEPVPVWSLAGLLGTGSESPAATGTVLLFNSVLGPWGLRVDRVQRSGALDPQLVRPLPKWVAPPEPSPFAGVLAGADGLRLLLEPDRLDPRRSPAIPPLPAAPPELGAESEVEHSDTKMTLAPASISGQRKLILFSTSPGGEAPVLFGLALSQIEEILRPQSLLKVPKASPSFLGLVAWRGGAVPILDLSLRMGAGPSFFEGESRFLIARGARSSERLGFAVRPEIRVLELPVANQPSQRGRLLDRSLVRGVFELDAGTVFFPDLDRFLAAGA